MSEKFDGAKMKQRRTDLRITQKELARAIGLSSITIGRYERNHRIPDSNTLVRIIQQLNCQYDDLFL